ncbi:MAG: TLD domain-containing protein [Terracidiphilus sp.]|nr:TLD domain-containing protein [Terracidiphilus sp.]
MSTLAITPAQEADRDMANGIAQIAALQMGIAAVAGRLEALHRRFIASCDTPATVSAQLVTATGREGCDVAFACQCSARGLAKAWEADAEEARVRAEQLEAYALLLEGGLDTKELAATIAAAESLLTGSLGAATCGLVFIAWDTPALFDIVFESCGVLSDVDPARWTVCGPGIAYFEPGCINSFTVAAGARECGDYVWDSMEAEDVTMSADGCSTIEVALSGPAAVEVSYSVDACRTQPITLSSLSVCGAALPGFPLRVQGALGNSAILAELASGVRGAFLHALTTVWLPGRTYTLLYKGSRDGMTPLAFHSMCDGMGPTLVLIRCDQGCIFGGYAGQSWESSPRLKFVPSRCADMFVFSVIGPPAACLGNAPVRFPVRRAHEHWALQCHSACGPIFDGGVYVRTHPPRASGTFDKTSVCGTLSLCYECAPDNCQWRANRDTSLNGTRCFLPCDMEVFAVGA